MRTRAYRTDAADDTARVLRVDAATIGKVERTPQGGLRVPATLTRSGVFTYQTPKGPIREYRPPEEVQRADSLTSLRGAPVTVRHPRERINPGNFRKYAAGHVGDDVRTDGKEIAASVYVQDEAAIRDIEAGTREVSCGYHCDTDHTPGITPDGEPYDRVQRNIVYNHLALTPVGRAGTARLRLDDAGGAILDDGDDRKDGGPAMEYEWINGVKFQVGTDAHRDACTRRDAADKARNDELAQARKERDEAKARADAADVERSKLTEQLKPAVFDTAVRERAAIVDRARLVLGKDFKVDATDTDGKPKVLTNEEIKRAAVVKAYPTIKLDSASADYINGLWASIEVKGSTERTQRDDAADRILRDTDPMPGAAPASRDPNIARSVKEVRDDAMEYGDQRCAKPLALSRRAPQSAQLETMK